MSTVTIKMSAFSNITYNPEFETEIPVEDWNAMSREERLEILTQALWEDIEVAAIDSETGEYLD